jgi:hypothetical protein
VITYESRLLSRHQAHAELRRLSFELAAEVGRQADVARSSTVRPAAIAASRTRPAIGVLAGMERDGQPRWLDSGEAPHVVPNANLCSRFI